MQSSLSSFKGVLSTASTFFVAGIDLSVFVDATM